MVLLLSDEVKRYNLSTVEVIKSVTSLSLRTDAVRTFRARRQRSVGAVCVQ